MGDIGTDGDTGVTDTEELVDETSSGDEDDTDEPSTESAGRHEGVIVIVHNGANLGIRGIDDDQRSLDPEFLIDPPVLKGIVPEDLVELVHVGCFEHARREVWVLAVLLKKENDGIGSHDDERDLTLSRMWSITSSISSGDILLAYSAASMTSGPRAWMSAATTSFRIL